MLFHRKFNIESHRFPFCLDGSFIGGAHNAGAAAGDHAITCLHQQTPQFLRFLIKGVFRLGPGRTENRNHFSGQFIHGFKTVHEFCHDPQDPPGIHIQKILIADKFHPAVQKFFICHPDLLTQKISGTVHGRRHKPPRTPDPAYNALPGTIFSPTPGRRQDPGKHRHHASASKGCR